jgi:PadR family transcriptional regulator, regulatory protein PadR
MGKYSGLRHLPHPFWSGLICGMLMCRPVTRPVRSVGESRTEGKIQTVTNHVMADLVRDVFLAFARVHILHHAAEGKIFGVGMMKELARHGYRLGPGTLYPLLHRLEENGLLESETAVAPGPVHGRARRYYAITRKGRLALDRIRPKLGELVRETLPDATAGSRAPPGQRKARSRQQRAHT